MAMAAGDEGLCVSFTEPLLLFEYSLDAFRAARSKGLYNTYVSNGYMTPEALAMLKEAGLDALKVDVKGDLHVYRRYCGAPSDGPVWTTLREAKRLGIHVEVVNLVVTGVNDDENWFRELARRVVRELGPLTPIHFTRYHPAFKFTAPPTKVEVLERAYKVATEEGARYVYLGNVPGHKYENTYCHECGELLIARRGFTMTRCRLAEGNRCPKCGAEIPIVGRCVVKPIRWL